MRADICGRHKKVVQEDDLAAVATPQNHLADDSAAAFFASDGRPASGRQILLGPRPTFEPIDVFVGRRQGWTGAVAQARVNGSGNGVVPANAAAFANANQPLQPGMPPVAASALPRGLSGASRGIGATATQAILVKSRTAKTGSPAKARREAQAQTPESAKAAPAKVAAAKETKAKPAPAKASLAKTSKDKTQEAKAPQAKAPAKKTAAVKVSKAKEKAE
jgi:hypothetical protein